jgi:hypothetical protein
VRLAAGVVAAASALVLVPSALASYIVDRNARGVTLRVSGGTAIVNWTEDGGRRYALLSGAINARAPQADVPQLAFRVRYGSGSRPGGSCRAYDGPALPQLVAACTAPDGSYWALQAWARLMPNYGGSSAPVELHASHWSGELPKLEVWMDWSYGGRFEHLFGRFTYLGTPVYGFRSTRTGNPLDAYGRNMYLDTLDSSYGSGWRRENSFLAHKGTGVFCYGFYPHRGRPGTGSMYRILVQGPGVTPIVGWSAPAPGPFDRGVDDSMNTLMRSFGDPLCRQR